MKKYIAELFGTFVLVFVGCGTVVFSEPYVGNLGIAFAFGLAAEIERQLISERTKSSLANIKANGKKLGRPFSAETKKLKLAKNQKQIQKCYPD